MQNLACMVSAATVFGAPIKLISKGSMLECDFPSRYFSPTHLLHGACLTSHPVGVPAGAHKRLDRCRPGGERAGQFNSANSDKFTVCAVNTPRLTQKNVFVLCLSATHARKAVINAVSFIHGNLGRCRLLVSAEEPSLA